MLFMYISFIFVLLLGLFFYIFSNIYLKNIFKFKCLLSVSKTYIERLSNFKNAGCLLDTNLLNHISTFLYDNHPMIPTVFYRYITHYKLFFNNSLDKVTPENAEIYYEMGQVFDEILNWMIHNLSTKIALYEAKLSQLNKLLEYLTFVVTAILSLFAQKLNS